LGRRKFTEDGEVPRRFITRKGLLAPAGVEVAKTLLRATSEGYVAITVQQSLPYFLQESSAGVFDFLVLAELQHLGPITA